MTQDDLDPRGVIREAYRIDGIDEGECRSIFLDWALHAPADPTAQIRGLLERHEAAAPDHPMTGVLRAGLQELPAPRRRGGAGGRAGR